ncbi:hypothetical protein C9374_013935 [Naegleria lovaniensis]|uniref:GH16 domain-containing protein n=1 Tax=Naegleria lovaniensis TaxID=51637 RepID=A0AA88GUW1_NAELO|nr:uncharacterized protein C9374_013935 [Naegleria lovaniensis]KAG2389375.1 hypothetical protein C9374_013935 [Naegleria lovaniensis]
MLASQQLDTWILSTSDHGNKHSKIKTFAIPVFVLIYACFYLAASSMNVHAQWTEPVAPQDLLHSYVPPNVYQMVFNDEFNGPSLNRTKWKTRYIYNGGTLDYLNDEIQRYRDNNNHVFENGCLKLVARHVNNSRVESGMIRSVYETRYGYYEARIKMPWARGVWPAFWLNSGYSERGNLSWPPEIDIFEFVVNGVDDNPGPMLNMLHYGVITRPSTPSQLLYKNSRFDSVWNNFYASADLSKVWTTYGLEWNPSNVSVYVNSTRIYTRTYSWVYPSDLTLAGPAHVLLNLAIGGSWAGKYGVNYTAFPQALEIDWVRVYKPVENEGGQNNGNVGPMPNVSTSQKVVHSRVNAAMTQTMLLLQMMMILIIVLAVLTVFH